MAIARITLRWSGFQGGPGYSNFHFTADAAGGDFTGAEGLVYGFINPINQFIPVDVDYQVEPEVPLFDEGTGELLGYGDSLEAGTPGSGGAAGSYSAASGAVVNWLTNTVNRGRRVQGRTFIVPLALNAYEDNGTLSSEALTAFDGAAANLSTAGSLGEFVVWSRPVNGSGGAAAPVVGHRIPDMAAVLRSRRD